ncbi:hypothetical protein [Streptomyces sp. NPDC088246]|uniref:hypothetical protein n=1 Tax=Streptomyces sp. NPDC088246 TaxID=3365842 RepID=UPI0038237125
MDPHETQTPRAAGHAEVRIVAASPQAARAVAEILRHCFDATEQRSYPTPAGATRLHLTVDTEAAVGPARSRLATSRPPTGTGAHADET